MSTPEPTAEHIDAVARVAATARSMIAGAAFGHPQADAYALAEGAAKKLLTTDDPDAQAALAANLPREVMLAALVADGTLGKEEAGGYSDGTPRQWVESIRYVTDWETTT